MYPFLLVFYLPPWKNDNLALIHGKQTHILVKDVDNQYKSIQQCWLMSNKYSEMNHNEGFMIYVSNQL